METQTGSGDTVPVTPRLPEATTPGASAPPGTASGTPPANRSSAHSPYLPMGATAAVPGTLAGEVGTPPDPAGPTPTSPDTSPAIAGPSDQPATISTANWTGLAPASGVRPRRDRYGIASAVCAMLVLPVVAIPLGIISLVRISREKSIRRAPAVCGLLISLLTIVAGTVMMTTDNSVHTFVQERLEAASNPQLGRAADACKAGDNYACDHLATIARPGSSYFAVADTCGISTHNGGLAGQCVLYSIFHGINFPASYDGFFAALVAGCQAGELAACDLIDTLNPADLDTRSVGDDCGGNATAASATWCGNYDLGTGEGWAAYVAALRDLNLPAPGANAAWDSLWTTCAAGDMAACDKLLNDVGAQGDVVFVYKLQSATCGFTVPPRGGQCAQG